MPDGNLQQNAGGVAAPTVRLVLGGPVKAVASSIAACRDFPALLLSYFYLKQCWCVIQSGKYRDWVLDSGAYSASNSGKQIRLSEYLESIKALREGPYPPVEVFALDVIGDPKASRVNTEKMWKAGVDAIPTFHIGEPWDVLKGLAGDYPKIAVGGMVGKSAKLKHRFISEVFARVWPCKIHGFGISSRPLVMGFPFHSVDASSWEIAPTAFGTWAGFNGARLSVRGSKQNLVSEVRHYLALERDARARWAAEWAKFQQSQRPVVRLAINRPHSWENMGTI